MAIQKFKIRMLEFLKNNKNIEILRNNTLRFLRRQIGDVDGDDKRVILGLEDFHKITVYGAMFALLTHAVGPARCRHGYFSHSPTVSGPLAADTGISHTSSCR